MTDETSRLADAVEKLNDHYMLRGPLRGFWPMMLNQFARGLAFGLGSVLGASFLVYLVVLTLSQIEVIPIIGDWAAQINAEIQRQR